MTKFLEIKLKIQSTLTVDISGDVKLGDTKKNIIA